MNLFALLRKPAWEHKDADRRAAAVASETHPDLVALLPELVRNDADVQVRLAALRRIDDLSLLADRMRNDGEPRMREAARQRYLQRLLDPSWSIADRERLLAVEEDAEILAVIAQQAVEPVLRRLALERTDRSGLIIERCVTDPDPELRRWLLDRIDDTAALERIAERARKSDKLLARTARERVQAAKLAAGDPQATRERALEICDELDALRRSVAADADTRREALRQEWQGLAPRLDAAMERRVQGYFSALDAALAPPPPPAAPEVVVETVEVAPDVPAREPDPALAALLAELEARAARLAPGELEALRSRWAKRAKQVAPLLDSENEQEARFNERASALQARFDELERQRKTALDGAADKTAQLEAALEAGHLAAARELQQQLDADRKLLGERFPRALARRLGAAGGELERLGRWQHWSDNKARLALIDEAEALGGSGLHPDALAVGVKELQARWQQLEEAENRAAKAQHPLARRFHAACHRAIAPARPYFEKRRELRGARREEIEAFLNEARERLEATPDLRELLDLRRQIIDQLRLSDELEPGARREIGQQLRQALDQVKAGISQSETDAEAGKRKLIANLRRDLMHAELATALPLARQAQATWKTLPRAARKVDDALWKELRELVDPWFSQADAQVREQQAAASARTEEAKAILAELDELADAEASVLAHAESRLAGLQTRWRALADSAPETPDEPPAPARRMERRPPRRAPREGVDERAFDRAVAKVRTACARLAEVQRHDELRSLLAAGLLIDEAEALTGTSDAAQRDAFLARLEALALAGDARPALQARLHAAFDAPAQTPGPDEPAPEARARELTVLAELALERDSPEADRELRRRIQIERLSRHLSGEQTRDELRELLLGYVTLGGVPAPLRHALSTRWQGLLEAGGGG